MAVEPAAGDPTASGYFWVQDVASGGMGKVELVLRSEGTFRRFYAIKRLLPHLLDDASMVEMFLDEARIAGLVRHPNLVAVLDVGRDELGPFLVMDFVEGVAAVEILRGMEGDPLPASVAVQIVMQAAEGLHAAHEASGEHGELLELVHRDVSPQNLLVGFDGIVRVADFGIARALGRSSKTSTGTLKGKMGYMSPEQLRFEDLDRRSDLFSLGVVLFELLTGERLYKTDGPRRILHEPTPDIGAHRDDLPPSLVELCFELLAKDPSMRPSTAREVSLRLQGVLNELATEDDAVALGPFVVARCAEAVARSKRIKVDAHARLDDGTLPGWPRVEPPAHASSVVEPPPVSGRSARRRPSVWMGLAALVLLAAGAVGGVLFVGLADGSNVDEGGSEPAAERTPVTSSAAPPVPVTVIEAPAERPDEEEPEPDAESTEDTTQPTPRSRRRRRRRAPSASTETRAVEPSASSDDRGDRGGEPARNPLRPWAFGGEPR